MTQVDSAATGWGLTTSPAAGPTDLAVLGFGLACLGYAALAMKARTLHARGTAAQPHGINRALMGALVTSAVWALLEALESSGWKLLAGGAWPSAWAMATHVADVLRSAAWLLVAALLLRPLWGREVGLPMVPWVLALLVAMALLGSVGDGGGAPGRVHLAGQLGLAVAGLVMLEQLLRNLSEEARWALKPLGIGLGLGFLFELILYSGGVLFGRLDADAMAVRGLVHAMAVPFLAVGLMRWAGSPPRLRLSRSMAFYSASLAAAGGYLLFMAMVGYYVRYAGGEWGRALQMAVVAVAMAGLMFLALSSSARAHLRVQVAKHFFPYRYDYRQEWLRFTAKLSRSTNPAEVGSVVIAALADMVESPGGSLWLLDRSHSHDGRFVQASRHHAQASDSAESCVGAFAGFLRQTGWVIDLDEFRQKPNAYEGLAVPYWMLAQTDAQMVVPLQSSEELIGFVVLARSRVRVDLNWEVRDLLKTAARQAAGHLAQLRATEALLEARKFEAFNKMSAFVVHDLKNIVTQLSLMMRNSRRLQDNPAFRADMLDTVDNAVERMRRLMTQLREGANDEPSRPVDLAALLQQLQQRALQRGRAVQLRETPRLSTRGSAQRLERVLGHLLDNALDATEAHKAVWISLRREHSHVVVEVGDEGQGMSEDFMRERLFRAFSSTKSSGMGIGLHESLQYVRELGGRIEPQSSIGRGTVMTVWLPLLDAGLDLPPLELNQTA